MGGRTRRAKLLVTAGAAALTLGVVVAVLLGRGDDLVGLERCADVPILASRLEGNLGARQNPDPVVMDVIRAYRDEHADIYGEFWIDRENRALERVHTSAPCIDQSLVNRL